MEKTKIKAKNLAYEMIKKQILSGELGAGVMLSENALSKELGMSRTPIREAMCILESEGFIQTFSTKGCIVVKLDTDDIVNYMQVREGLEGVAARVAAPKADRALFTEILNELEAIDLSDESQREMSFKTGRRLHQLILATAGNKEIIRIVGNLSSQMNRIMMLSRNAESRSMASHAEHLVIARAMVDRDADLAEKSMRSHIIATFNDAIKVLRDYLTVRKLSDSSTPLD